MTPLEDLYALRTIGAFLTFHLSLITSHCGAQRHLSSGHHLQQKTFEILGLRQRRHDRMIERLFESAQFSRGTPGVDQGIGDRFGERSVADVMGAGECRKQALFR
jgi:hypothetical protein